MIRANGFALFRGQEASRRARDAMEDVDRFSRARLASSQGEAFRAAKRGLGRPPIVLAYSLDGVGTDYPVMHGFSTDQALEEGEEPRFGEFAFLARRGETRLAGRDALGTRPLYVAGDGSVVASDHRFFPADRPPRLLARGTTVEVGPMRTRVPRKVVPSAPGSLEESASRLGKLLDESVERRVKGRRRVAVSFSGGLDSSLIAMLAAKHTEVTLCSAYVGASADEKAASFAASLLDLKHVSTKLDGVQVMQELRSLDLPFQTTAMDRALWCLYSSTARTASEEASDLMLLGQLADELFGGYMKYAVAARREGDLAKRMMETDVEAAAERAFVRDEAACARYVEPGFPFADEGVVGLALGLPVSYKISSQKRKLVLRLAADELGLPEKLVQAPKKAAQYSSGIAKLVR